MVAVEEAATSDVRRDARWRSGPDENGLFKYRIVERRKGLWDWEEPSREIAFEDREVVGRSGGGGGGGSWRREGEEEFVGELEKWLVALPNDSVGNSSGSDGLPVQKLRENDLAGPGGECEAFGDDRAAGELLGAGEDGRSEPVKGDLKRHVRPAPGRRPPNSSSLQGDATRSKTSNKFSGVTVGGSIVGRLGWKEVKKIY